MSIDSEKKRRAAAGSPFPWSPTIKPDGTIDEQDRRTLSGAYGREVVTAEIEVTPLSSPLTLVEIDFESGTRFYSFEGVRATNAFYKDQVLSVDSIEREVPLLPDIYRIGDISITLSNADLEFSILKGTDNFRSRTVRVLFGDANGLLPCFTGIIQSWTFAVHKIIFNVRDSVSLRLGNSLQGKLSPAELSGWSVPTTEPQDALPIIYGTVSSVGGTNTGAVRALRIGEFDGYSVYYLVARHPCAAVLNVYRYGQKLDPSQYVVDRFDTRQTKVVYSSVSLPMLPFTTVKFTFDPRDPTRVNTEDPEVTVDVEGRTDDGSPTGALITNPADQLMNYLKSYGRSNESVTRGLINGHELEYWCLIDDNWMGDLKLIDHVGGRHALFGAGGNSPYFSVSGVTFGGDDYISGPVNSWETHSLDLVYYTATDITPGMSPDYRLYAIDDSSHGYLSLGGGYWDDEVLTLYNGVGAASWRKGSAILAGWHLIQLNWNGTDWDLYFDGVEQPLYNFSTQDHLPAASTNTFLGAGDDNGPYNPFTGTIGWFSTYSKARSLDQIRADAMTLENIMSARGVTMPATLPSGFNVTAWAAAKAKLTAMNYMGGFAITKQMTHEEVCNRFCESFGLDFFGDRTGLFSIALTALSDYSDTSVIPAVTDQNDILKNSFSITQSEEAVVTRLQYNSRYNWVKDYFESQPDLIDQFSERRMGLSLRGNTNLWFVRDSIIATDVAQRRLLLTKDVQEIVSFDLPVDFFNKELCELLRVTHWEGIASSGIGYNQIVFRICGISLNLEPTQMRLSIKAYRCIFVADFWRSYAKLDDAATAAANWNVASDAQKQYLYLGDGSILTAGAKGTLGTSDPAKILW